ncbi:MAG: Ig-like domain-containing protein, partial [Lachnospiraceae bacterium]|nr:Ig-like domain-containing protein [Lachnospiraceae bacterium]
GLDSHAAKFRYASSNKKIATVTKNGKIKAKKKGTSSNIRGCAFFDRCYDRETIYSVTIS